MTNITNPSSMSWRWAV